MADESDSSARPAGTQTVERALHLLDVLAANGEPMRLSQLAQATAFNISTTSRLLGALDRFGYVDREQATGRYRLGYKLLRLAQVILDQLSLPEMANPILARLMEQTGETATLCVRHDDDAIVIARAECANPLRSVAQIGHTGPLYCTAHGKAMLAHLPEREVAEILERGMPGLTDATIIDPAQMAAALAEIRARGYAIDVGEREAGLISIAAPVRDAADRVVATCGVSGSSLRMRDEALPRLAAMVTAAADTLSGQLGCRSPRARAAGAAAD